MGKLSQNNLDSLEECSDKYLMSFSFSWRVLKVWLTAIRTDRQKMMSAIRATEVSV